MTTRPNTTRPAKSWTVIGISVWVVLCGKWSPLGALPTGGTTVAGSGQITESGNTLTVDQASSRLAIDWQSFSIGAGQSVIFRQPSAQSIALNRVLGQDPSEIFGNLSANGQVFVLNPNGVLFGRGAQVSVGALLASTLQLSVADFLAGRYTLSGSDSSGSVVNQGSLHARDGGYIALLAPQVVNEGVITAKLGTAVLGAGRQVSLTIDGGHLLSFNVDRDAVDALVSNKQLIEADGGTVILSARAKDALLSTVINNQGIVEARSVSSKDGVILLDGGTSGVVATSGTLDASGTSAGERGGQIQITGDKVGLFDGAMVNASGAMGGGTILIGGDTQGRNPNIYNARAAYVAPTATIHADALDTGSGGKVVVWSDDMTRFAGTISARGGLNGGNGGSVETSGKAYLDASGAVDASAPSGLPGDWLLDPYDVTLSSAASSNGAFAGGVFTPSGNSAIANTTTIQTSLNGGTSVTINTAGAGAQAGDITVANAIAKTAGGAATLTLNATNQITFSAGANLTSTTGALSIALNAGAGGISNLQNVNTNGGSLTFNTSGAATQAAGSVISGSGTLVKQNTGTLTLSGANTYTGATTISAGTLTASSATALGTTAGGVVVSSGATLNINGVAIGAEALTLNGTGVGGNGALTGTGTASLSGAIALASASSISAPSVGDTLTLSGVISGANALTKLGAGTLVLSGANTYSGATSINAGTVQLGAANRIAATSDITIASGAVLNLNNFAEAAGSIAGAGNITLGTGTLTAGGDNASTTFSGVVSGTGGFTKAGTGTTTLSGVNTYTGATTVNGGSLSLLGGSAIADTSAVSLANTAGVSLALNGTNETIGSLAGGGATGGNVSLGAGTLNTGGNNTATTYSGVISGTGGLTKTGTGAMTLSGANTYTGPTTVNAGTLQLGAANRIAATSDITVASGAVFNLNNFAQTAGSIAGAGNITLGTATLTAGGDNATTTFSGVLSGTGAFTKAGTGTTTLSGANTYTGATTISAGTLIASNATALGTTAGGVVVSSGATLNINNVAIGAEALTLNGAGVGGNGALTGTGTASLAGNIALASAGSAGTPNVSDTLTLSGVISGANALTKLGAGTLVLSGANTYSGATFINAGTLKLSAANRIAATSDITVASGAVLNLNNFSETAGSIAGAGNITLGTATLTAGGDNASTTFSGAISGTGNVTKQGTGTLTLSGVNTYTGATTINGGTLGLLGGSAIADTSAVILANTAGASLALNGTNETIGSLAGGGATGGNVALGAGTLIIGADNTSTTYSGVIAGTGGVTKFGTGTLTLAGANTYAGATSVNAGTLSATNTSSLGTGLGGATVNTGGTLSISANILGESLTLNGGTLTKDNAATTRTWSGGVTLAAPSVVAIPSGTLTLSGTIDGTGDLNKSGAGTLTLSGSNLYSGQTNVNAGTLQVSGGNGIGDASAVSLATGATLNLGGTNETVGSLAGAGNVVLGAGTLTAGGANTSTTYSGVISGTGGLTKTGIGTFTLTGNSTYSGATTISAGTLQLGTINGIAGTSTVTVASGAIFDLNNFNETVGSIAGAGNVTLGTATLTAGGNNTSTTYAGVISGTGDLTKTGSGTLTLTGSNTYGGATTVSAGTLQLGTTDGIAATSDITVASGAIFNLNNFDETAGSIAGAGNITLGTATLTAGGDNASTTFSGAISGTGNVTKQGTGTLTLSGVNTYTGATTINGGTLGLLGGSAIADTSAVILANTAGASLALNGTTETIGSLAGGGTAGGDVALGAGTLTIGADNTSTTYSGVIAGTGGVTKVGTGTLALAGANTYAGATSVNAGTLQVSGGNGIGDASAVSLATGTTLDLGDTNETVGSLTGAGNVVLGAGTLTTGGNNTSTTYSGVISGTGGLTKTGIGTFTLTGNNTYSGATTIGTGTLQLGTTNGIATASDITVASGAIFDLNNFDETAGSIAGAGNVTLGTATLTAGGNDTSTTYSGVISGTGGLTKTGIGTLTLTGNSTYSGATSISAGTLQLGTTNGIAATSDVTLASGAIFDLNNFDETAGSIAGAGNITLGTGTLTAGGDNASTTFSGVISGTGNVTKQGTGTLTFSGVNTYTGATTINGGTLSLLGGNAIADASAVTLANAAGVSLALNGVDETIGSLAGGGATGGNVALGAGTLTIGADNTSTTYSGVIDGTGGVSKIGTGTLTLAGANTYSGDTTIAAGILRDTGGNGIGATSSVTILTGASLDLADTDETVGSLAGAGNVALGAGTLTAGGNNTSTLYSGVISGTGGLIKSGTGTLTLSGSNTYSGATNIGVGTLVASNSTALGNSVAGATVANGATLQIADVALNGVPLTLNGNGVGGAGALIGTGTASVAGPITLAAATRISAAPGDALSLTSTVDGPGALDIVGGGTISLGGAVGGTTALASITSDLATALRINGGLVATSGTQAYNGLTTLSGSTTLRTVGGGDIEANGPISESIGTLTLDTDSGNATLTNVANDLAAVAVTSGNAVSLVDASALTLGASNLGTLQARTLSGNLTLNGTITASRSGDAIVLAAAANFSNPGSASLLPGTGRWLIYSTNPASNSLGGLTSDFKRYNCTFMGGCLTPGTTVPVTGNGLLYSLAPTLSVAANSINTIYGTPTSSLTYSASGFVDGDTAATALSGALVRTIGGMSGSGNEVVGTYSITQGTVAASLGYQLSFTGASYTISPRPLAVSAAAQNKVYDGTVAVTASLTGNQIAGDAVVTSFVNGSFADPNAGTGKTVNISGISLSGADAGNYSLASNSITTLANITAKPIIVSAANQTKVYGSADPTLTYAVSAGDLVGSDTLSGSLVRQPGETVAGGPYAITQGTLTNSNYSITFNDGALAITPATLTYVADPVSLFQWNPLPPLNGSVTGFVAGDSLASATTGALTFSAGTPNSETAGVFASTGSGLTANFGNYIFAQAAGNASALVVRPSEEPRASDAPPEAYSGALNSTTRMEGPCARFAQTDGASSCDFQEDFAASRTAKSLPARKRGNSLVELPLVILNSGLRLPASALPATFY